MSSPPEPFSLRCAVRRGLGYATLPTLAPLTQDPDGLETAFAFDEFDQVRISLESPDPDAVLYLEGLERAVRAGSPLELTDRDDPELNAYPWYPGNYELRLEADGITWYGLFQVRPRHFPQVADLEGLRRDLEELVAGLSLDLALGRGYMGRHASRPQSGGAVLRINQLWLLKQALGETEPALRRIALAPHRRLDREHQVLPWQRARRLDGQSLRWLARGGGLHGGGPASGSGWQSAAVLAPRPATSYDTYENRVIAFVLGVFVERSEQLLAALLRDLDGVRQQLRRARAHRWSTHVLEEREGGYLGLLPLVQETTRVFAGLRRQPWLDRVGHLSQPPRPTLVLLKDPRYRTLFQWYRRLSGALVRVDTHDHGFAVRAKRTSTLYEYWCLYRILAVLGELGFTLRGGWLAQQLRRWNRDRLVPVIPAGAEFWLEGSGERRLRLAYDRELPRTAEAARAQYHEFYIASARHRPDMRLDLYLSGLYQRSLVLDAKYSRITTIWDEHRYGERMAQLQSYAYTLFHISHPGRQTVKRVVALYPGGETDPEWQEREDGRIALARLVPGATNETLLACLREFLGGGPEP